MADTDYSVYFDTVQELYIGYYQRPADPEGLLYWASALAAADTNGNGKIDTGEDINKILIQFATSPESVAIYGPITSANISNVVTQIYENLFNRPPEAAGLAFYVNGFNAGLIQPGQMVWQILNGAQGTDALSVDNKVTAAEQFTQIIDPNLDGRPPFDATYAGLADGAAAAAWLHDVGWDAATIPSMAETRTFIVDHIADPGDPVITNPQLALTEQTDFIDLTATGGITTVTGVQESPVSDGTYTHGDQILGNGATIVKLVVDSGEGNGGAFATISNVSEIQVVGAADSTIEALQFTNVGQINLVDGNNGVDVFVDGLDLGTQIGVADVAGSISASFDDVAGGAHVYGWLENSGANEDLSTLLIDPDVNITMNLQKSASGSVDIWGGPVNVGTVNVMAADDTWSGIFLDADGSPADDVVAGDVTVEIGNSASFYFDAYANDAITVGNISISAGDVSMAEVDLGDIHNTGTDAEVGNITVGNISTAAGDDSSAIVAIGADSYATYYNNGADATVGNIAVGNVDMAAGDGSYLAFGAGAGATADNYYYYSGYGDAYATAGDITVANIVQAAGDGSSLDVFLGSHADAYDTADAEVGSITVGDVDMTAGNGSTLDLYVGASASGTYDYYNGDAYATVGAITMGDINMVAGDGQGLDAYIGAQADGWDYADATVGDVDLGNINMAAGDDTYVELFIGAAAYASYTSDEYVAIGAIDVGNVSMAAGDDSRVDLYVGPSSDGYATVGDINVADVSLEVGNVTSIDSNANASVTISSWAHTTANKGVANDLTVGDITVAVGDGFVSEMNTNEALGYVGLYLTGQVGAGDMTVGDVTMSGGDFASLTLHADHEVSTGDLGAFEMGNVDIEAGESAYVAVSITNSVSYTGDIATFDLGKIDVAMQQDSYVDIDINNTAGYYSPTKQSDIGDMAVGDISIVSGDNSTADINIDSEANHGSNGAMSIGDISVALSATTTVDLSGGSTISVSIEHYAWDSFDSLGALTVGDIDLSAGNGADIDLYIYDEATAADLGNMEVGNITISAGNASDVSIGVYYTNNDYAGGVSDMGNFTLAGVDVQMGNDAFLYASMTVSQDDVRGDIGNVSFGDVTLGFGNGADSFLFQSVSAEHNVESLGFGNITLTAGNAGNIEISQDATISGDLGGLSYGNMNLQTGTTTIVDVSSDIFVSGEIGDVTVGNLDAVIGASSDLIYALNVEGEEGIGNVAVGNVSVSAGASASITDFSIQVSSSFGSISSASIGNVSVTLGKDANMYDSYFSFSADSGDIGNVTVGDVTLDLAAGASISDMYFGVYGDANVEKLTAGDITITAVDAVVTETVPGSYGALDVGKHIDGAYVDLYYTLSGTSQKTLEVGDVTVHLDTLSDIDIFLSVYNGAGGTGDGNIVIGDLTVTGAVGAVAYTGGAVSDSGYFVFAGGSTVLTNGTITIGNVDYSGYVGAVDIDMSWTDLGAANITGNGSANIITGNGAANTINGGAGADTLYGMAGNDILNGGTGADNLYGGAGNDTFLFNKGDSGTTSGVDIVWDWSQVLGNADKLDFNNGAGSAANYVEWSASLGSAPATDLASFVENANDALNSTIKFYAEEFGGNTYVAVNYGSGDADQVVELAGVGLGAIDYSNIIA